MKSNVFIFNSPDDRHPTQIHTLKLDLLSDQDLECGEETMVFHQQTFLKLKYHFLSETIWNSLWNNWKLSKLIKQTNTTINRWLSQNRWSRRFLSPRWTTFKLFQTASVNFMSKNIVLNNYFNYFCIVLHNHIIKLLINALTSKDEPIQSFYSCHRNRYRHKFQTLNSFYEIFLIRYDVH